MTHRPQPLQGFMTALHAAIVARAQAPQAQTMLSQVFEALAQPGKAGPSAGTRISACRHLDAVAPQPDALPEDLRHLMQQFRALEPSLIWRPRSGSTAGASESFAEGHANTMIVGPGGLERRTDASIGATILAPHVRYPDHTHPPEETYLVLSPGHFSHDHQPWVEPGVGGTFHNVPGIVHTMMSGTVPLFAFWVLSAQGR